MNEFKEKFKEKLRLDIVNNLPKDLSKEEVAKYCEEKVNEIIETLEMQIAIYNEIADRLG